VLSLTINKKKDAFPNLTLKEKALCGISRRKFPLLPWKISMKE
jgi:hypothetical protein